MRAVDIIEKKRNNEILIKAEIDFLISGYVAGKIPDYQMSAMLMAIYFNSMNDEETAYLTNAMIKSGDEVDLSDIKGIKVDKHSTGGVADTTTLILAPLVAACGATVCKMSGRGLGHTGGTLDKLESIEGFNVVQSIDSYKDILRSIGLSIIGQSGNLAPADKLLYSLRDVTGTINSIPLIASSIMSKKIAAGCDAVVLDVKTGNGSFLNNLAEAKALAKAMVGLGKAANIKTRAIITDMNQPLGNAIGNALEVKEAIEVLNGSNKSPRLKTVALALGANMLEVAHITKKEEALPMLQNAIDNKSGIAKLKELVIAQGGNPNIIDNPNLLPSAKYIYTLKAKECGYIHSMNTTSLGKAACILGAGREKKSDIIDPAVGYVMECELSQKINKGDTICTIYYNDSTNLKSACSIILNSIIIKDSKPQNKTPLMYE